MLDFYPYRKGARSAAVGKSRGVGKPAGACPRLVHATAWAKRLIHGSAFALAVALTPAQAQLVVSDPVHTAKTLAGWGMQYQQMYDQLTRLRTLVTTTTGRRETIDAFLSAFVRSFAATSGVGRYGYQVGTPSISLGAGNAVAARNWQDQLARLEAERGMTRATIEAHEARRDRIQQAAVQAALSEDPMAIQKAQALIQGHVSQLAELELQMQANQRAADLDRRALEMQQAASMYGRSSEPLPQWRPEPLPVAPWRR